MIATAVFHVIMFGTGQTECLGCFKNLMSVNA